MIRAPFRSSPPARSAPGIGRSWRRIRRPTLVAIGGVLGVLVLVLAMFGPLVRARVAREAERRNLEIDVARIRPGFFAVALHDVRVRPRGAPGLEARLEEVRATLSASFGLRELSVHGGVLLLQGEPEEVVQRLRDLRASSAEPHRDAAHPSTPLEADGLALDWKLPSGGEITGAGLRIRRDASSTKLGCTTCSVSQSRDGKKLLVEIRGADVELAPDGQPRRVDATTLDVTYTPALAAASEVAASANVAEISPPPLPQASKRGKGGLKPAKDDPPGWDPVLRMPELHAIRARVATALAVLAPRLPEGGRVDIGGLSLKIQDREPLAFGPGAFHLTRRGDRVQLEFASVEAGEGKGAGTPLSIDADLPLGAGDMTARVDGGPVSLSALGVLEGMRGLTDVGHGSIAGKGQLVLSETADALTFDGSLALHGISLKEPRIAPEPLRGIDLSVSARGLLDDSGHLRLDDAQLDMGALHVRSHGRIEQTREHFSVALGLEVVPASCQSLLDSAPQGLLPLVKPSRMNGTFGAKLDLAFDTRTIDKLALDYRIDDQCRMVEVPRELAQDRFAGSFTYRTYHPDGSFGETTTGPGTPSWTSLDDISPFMIAAVLTTEDGAFYKHHGFNHAAIRASMAANLKARRFVRGASTITMQLAKNVFLARDKALSRKIEEVILTDYLEQVFRKDDMMELYLNVIEFGPDVYGITRAAEHYFARKPEELQVGECFFLASLLPSPIRYGKLREKGEVSESWMRHLRALMEIAARNGKISRAELEEGLKEPVAFVRTGEPRPMPRKPVTSTRRDPTDAAADWRPLE